MGDAVLRECADGVATLTLNQPNRANALSLAMLQELREILHDLCLDDSIRAVILTGAGSKVFCAGADLKERRGMNAQETRQTVDRIRAVVQGVADLPMPVIAAMNGSAFGGGLELALAADLRIAARSASMGLTETSLAIIPGAGGTQRLARLIGTARAKELVFTARRITAEQALALGLLNDVVPDEMLLERALGLAKEIAANGPIAVRQAKLAINLGIEVDLSSGLAIERTAYEVTIPTTDRLEGLAAFSEKRQPLYQGR